MSKITEWGQRYIPPTLLSATFSVLIATLFEYIFHNQVITALGGTWGDNLGFYGLIFYKDIKERRKKDKKISFIGILKVIRNAVAEFGVGEYLDSFIIRPTLMVVIPSLINNVPIGIFIAKFAADITFFLPTVLFYEIRKRIFKD